MTTFSELGLSDSIVSSLTELGFEEPTPIQNEAIPALLTGADVLGRAATGTGKTAAFSLPLLERHVLGQEADAPLVLVLTPTRELCLQVSEAFHNYGRKAGVLVTPIYGGQDYSRQIRALRRGTHVVVATPGRALDHIGRGTLDLTNIKAVVLDEADEMLDLGFADELDAIFDALPGHVQTALFSATLPPKIARIAEARLVDPVRITIAKEKTAEGETPRVPQIAYVVGHNYRTTALGRILDLEAPELAIIFTRTRMEVDDLTESLRARGFSVEALHGGLDQPTRDRVMKRARSGQIDAIVATDVAARGIDLENLTHVINFGIPASYETYVHRIGRTGRAGEEGFAISFVTRETMKTLKEIEKLIGKDIPFTTIEGYETDPSVLEKPKRGERKGGTRRGGNKPAGARRTGEKHAERAEREGRRPNAGEGRRRREDDTLVTRGERGGRGGKGRFDRKDRNDRGGRFDRDNRNDRGGNKGGYRGKGGAGRNGEWLSDEEFRSRRNAKNAQARLHKKERKAQNGNQHKANNKKRGGEGGYDYSRFSK